MRAHRQRFGFGAQTARFARSGKGSHLVAYRLKRGESVVHGLQRLAAKELRSAQRQLRGRARPGERIRSVNRALSELRDGDAMMSALTNLSHRDRGLMREKTFMRLRRRISAHKRDAMKAAARAGVWNDVSRQLRRLARTAKRWRPHHRGFDAVGPGIRITHRLGRQALAHARKSQRADASGSAIRRDIASPPILCSAG
jgi:hypothetical protein